MKKLLLVAVIFVPFIFAADQKEGQDVVKLWSLKLDRAQYSWNEPIIQSHIREKNAQRICTQKRISLQGVKDSTLFDDDRKVALARGSNVEIWDVTTGALSHTIEAESCENRGKEKYGIHLVAPGPQSMLACAARQSLVYIFHEDPKRDLRTVNRLSCGDAEIIKLEWSEEGDLSPLTVFFQFAEDKKSPLKTKKLSITPRDPNEPVRKKIGE